MKAYRYMADISSNNGPVHIPSYSRAGHAALVVKATEGTGYVNPFHFDQCIDAHDFGLTVVHYHFCSVGESIREEIANFRNTYTRVWRPGDYACFDIEVAGLDAHYANSLIGEYYRQTHREPIVYSDRSFIEGNLKGIHIPGGRMWVADYSSKPVTVPKPYHLWARQFTDGSDGPEPHFFAGIGRCDGSVITAGVASALYARKIKTRRRK